MPLSANLISNMVCAVIAVFCVTASGLAAQSLDYVGSEQCSDCHQDQSALWQGSHHALAWTMPGPQTVLGDFDNAEFAHDGTLTRFRTEDGKYYVTVTEKGGTTTDYPVHSVAGVEPLQQYLLETEPGRQQSFDVAWDTEAQRWYHLYPDQDLPPGDGLHWGGPYKTWNARCAECHATGYRRNFGLQTGTYASTQAEIGVGCEACHGPASAHVTWAKDGQVPVGSSSEVGETGFTIELALDGTTNDSGPDVQIEQCANCHSRRESLMGGNPIPGTPFHDAYTLATLRPGLYHPDGQIQDEVYVFGSFLQSKMYARGVGCTNCHDPHTAKLKAEGNAVCTQCHSPAGNASFPTLRQVNYDSPDHTFHPPDSDGAQCKSCHMIQRTYMGVDGRRDHSFRIPRPDLGSETGGPDACTDCHSDKTQDWAADQIKRWFPDSDQRGAHYGQVIAHGRDDPIRAAGSLLELALDETQPGIVRATALNLLDGQSNPELATVTAPLLAHSDPLIRANAAALQRGAAPELRLDRLAPLLIDPMRSVRIAAARQLLDVTPELLLRSQRAALGVAIKDWQRSLTNKLDFPEAHLVMGGMALTMRNFPAALRAFGEVVRLDPQRAEAWVMLVRLTSALEGREAARVVLRQATSKVPDNPVLLQLRAEMGQ
jgi:predicted CXXCH cytochrome family protein